VHFRGYLCLVYVGFLRPWIFLFPARLGSGAGNSIFGCQRLVGRKRLLPRIACTVYLAVVDCHLIHGYDVAVDVDQASTEPLYKAQERFFKQPAATYGLLAIHPG